MEVADRAPFSTNLPYPPRYVNTNNFLRSVRNFKIDVRLASATAYICGIHWQASGPIPLY